MCKAFHHQSQQETFKKKVMLTRSNTSNENGGQFFLPLFTCTPGNNARVCSARGQTACVQGQNSYRAGIRVRWCYKIHSYKAWKRPERRAFD